MLSALGTKHLLTSAQSTLKRGLSIQTRAFFQSFCEIELYAHLINFSHSHYSENGELWLYTIRLLWHENQRSDCCVQAQDAAGDAKSAAGDATGSAKSAGGDVAQSAKSAAGDAKGAAKSAGRQVDQATPDLSANPFDELLGKVQILL